MGFKMTQTKKEASSNKESGGILHKIAADIFDVAELFVFCASVILLLFTFVIRPTVVEGESMENTLLENDYLLVSDLFYTPTAGDIVVVHNISLERYGDPIIKRVIATEGQTIDIDFDTWTLTIDGKVIDEPYRRVDGGWRRSDLTFPLTVPEGHIFVMGDNRDYSADSRMSEIGMIDTRCVVGKAIMRIYPFSRFTLFD